MISQAESFLWPDKQGTPDEGRRIQRPKRCFTTNNNDEEKFEKNHNNSDLIN